MTIAQNHHRYLCQCKQHFSLMDLCHIEANIDCQIQAGRSRIKTTIRFFCFTIFISNFVFIPLTLSVGLYNFLTLRKSRYRLLLLLIKNLLCPLREDRCELLHYVKHSMNV